ncbi:MAG: 50S ribosomal protein L21 [Deltaproteobacteria bacterium]|jgi:large subunit ribosomal protein L21|nr:50S ribosomal protein L21 [Deltaproteobacteria bacterium]
MSKDNYAVINTGSKQYVVSQGDILRIETVGKEKGEEITFTPVAVKNGDVLLTDKQALKDKSVTGTVVRNGRAKKIVVFKMKRRKDERKKRGHRQNFTEVRITGIA